MTEPDRLLNHRQVLDLIGLRRTWLREAVAAGRFPAPTRVGRRTFWSRREVRDWIAARLNERAA